MTFLVTFLICTLLVTVGVAWFGHLAGIRNHRWHLRQGQAEKVLGLSRTCRGPHPSYPHIMTCPNKAQTECGKCWHHCPKCVRRTANTTEAKIAYLEKDLRDD